ncbi:UNVERIFIED_CONTAM: hypothetical protein K2H54_042769 [Gekko kuhli]
MHSWVGLQAQFMSNAMPQEPCCPTSVAASHLDLSLPALVTAQALEMQALHLQVFPLRKGAASLFFSTQNTYGAKQASSSGWGGKEDNWEFALP